MANSHPGGISRRKALIQISAVASGAALLLSQSQVLAATPLRKLSFQNLHTGERLTAAYARNGGYDDAALEQINYILRDWRSNEVNPIDPQLLDQLWTLRHLLDSHDPYKVISGYRSSKTNASLASQSNGVAKKSLHMQGRAIDVALEGRSIKEIGKTALTMKAGGVGFYSKSGFVHLDTGRVRTWGS